MSEMSLCLVLRNEQLKHSFPTLKLLLSKPTLSKALSQKNSMQSCNALSWQAEWKIFTTSIIWQGLLISMVQNCRQQFLKPCSGVELPMTEIASNGSLHLPKMRICRSGGNISWRISKMVHLSLPLWLTKFRPSLSRCLRR